MNLLYPKFGLRHFPRMLLFALGGAVVAGIYGALHDEVTYSIGSEYFTNLKFDQFYYLSREQPARLLVAEIGFIAGSAVGFFAAWFMARLTVPFESLRFARRRCCAGIGLIMGTALAAAAVGYAMAPSEPADARLLAWATFVDDLGIKDRVGFVRVAYVHYGSYLGALLGLIGTLVWLRITRPRRTCVS